MSGETEPALPRIRAFDRARDFEGMFAVTREIMSKPPYDIARRELLDYPAKGVVARVAETEGEGIVGFCAATHPYWNAVAMVDYLVVAPGWRRKAVGAGLMEAVESALKAAQLRRACVQTAAWNADGIRFYERRGYRRLAGLPGYLGDGEAMTMVWLDKSL